MARFHSYPLRLQHHNRQQHMLELDMRLELVELRRSYGKSLDRGAGYNRPARVLPRPTGFFVFVEDYHSTQGPIAETHFYWHLFALHGLHQQHDHFHNDDEDDARNMRFGYCMHCVFQLRRARSLLPSHVPRRKCVRVLPVVSSRLTQQR